MSLYSLAFGQNPIADVLLGVLGLKRDDVGRFRDAFVSGGEIAIYTRNGGGNRDEYQHVFDTLSGHQCYLRDEDDEFDCTYATIYFRFPEEFAEGLRAIDSGEKFDPDARWAKLLDSLRAADEKVGGV